MKIGSLFSGYSGLEMGVQVALGGEVAWHSEIDPGACKVLAHRFPGVPNLGDITAVDWTQVEPVDVLCGGSPCQDVSHAGKRAGMKAGTRSGLWASMCDAIDALRPPLVVWENVRGVLSAEADSALEPCAGCVGERDDGPVLRALGRVLGDLAGLGYDCRWHGLRAADVGAPHGRFRVFVVAYPNGERLARPELATAGRRPAPDDTRGLDLTAADADDLGRERPGSARGRRGGPADGGRGDGGARECLSPISATVAASALPGNTAATDPMGGASATAPTSCAATGSEGLLPTPTSRDGKGHNQRGDTTCLTGALMPTPRATDGTKGSPNQRGSSGDLMLLSAVALLPTPAVNDMGEGKTVEAWDEWTTAMQERHGNGNGHGKSLAIEAQRLLPTPNAADAWVPMEATENTMRRGDPNGPLRSTSGSLPKDLGLALNADRWGIYADAIARWEHLTRPAPAPTQPSKKGTPQLNAAFSEWMLGLPDGWVTDVPGLSRNDMLRILGNGVVPQQAAAALRLLLPTDAEAVA